MDNKVQSLSFLIHIDNDLFDKAANDFLFQCHRAFYLMPCVGKVFAECENRLFILLAECLWCNLRGVERALELLDFFEFLIPTLFQGIDD